MSDPIINVEIEDVLSSIRRLVTEESRSGPRKSVAKTAAPGKLVLTQALRVPGESNPSDADQAAAPKDESREPWRNPSATLFQAARPDFEDLPWYKRKAEDTAEATGPMREAIEADVLHLSDPVILPEADKVEPLNPERDSRAAALSAKIAALEAAIAETRDQWEPDGELGDDYAGTQVANMAWDEHPAEADALPEAGDHAEPEAASDDLDQISATMGEDVALAAPDLEDDSETPEDMPEVAAVPEVEVDIQDDIVVETAALPDADAGSDAVDAIGSILSRSGQSDETEDGAIPLPRPVAVQDDTPEDQPLVLDETETPAIEDRERIVDSAAATPDPEPIAGETLSATDPEPDGANARAGMDETVLDEDSLRELVADIVRQELQGALGERITRNVRKLVRREIHRALSVQDLD